MTIENKASFIVDLKGNVPEKSRSFGRDIANFGDKGSRSMQKLSAETNTSTNLIGGLTSKIAALASIATAMKVAKEVGDWQQKKVELGTQYNLTASEVKQLDQSILDTANRHRTSYDDMTQASTKFLERTNDLSALQDNFDNIALAMKGIGLSADDAGKKIGELKNKGYSASEIKEVLNATANATKFGTGDIKEQFNRVLDTANSTGWNSPEQFKQLLALERLGDKSLGESGKAAGALEQFHKAIQDPDKQKILRRNGVEVFKDPKNKELKDPSQIFLEMGDASRFNTKNINDIIGGDFVKLMQSFQSEEMQDSLKNAFKDADNNLIEKKANVNGKTANGAGINLGNKVDDAKRKFLTPVVYGTAELLNSGEVLNDYLFAEPTQEEIDDPAKRTTATRMKYSEGEAYASRGFWLPNSVAKKTEERKERSSDEVTTDLRKEIFVESDSALKNNDDKSLDKSFFLASKTFAEFNAQKQKDSTENKEPGQGEITIKIESEKGLAVKTQSVTAKNLDINVDTGNLRYGNY